MKPAYSGRRNEVPEGSDRTVWHTTNRPRFGVAVAASVCAFLLAAHSAMAVDISFRSFSKSAAIGPPAVEYAAKLLSISTTAFGESGQIRFVKYSPTPAIPEAFKKNIVAAVKICIAGIAAIPRHHPFLIKTFQHISIFYFGC